MFNGYKILVIGDTCIDKFQYVDCYKLSPESPAPVARVVKQTINPGMAGNVVECLKSLAPDSKIYSLFQDKEILKERIVDIKYNHHFIRLDYEDDINRIKLDKDILKELFIYDAVIISDYNKGFLLEEDIESILNACSIYEVPTFLDTKKKAGEFADKTFCVKINEKEYNLSPEWPLHCQNLIVTLGGDGARFSSKFLRSISKINGYKVDVSSIIGCGDCFLASLVLKYLETKDFRQSIDFANYCAAISASKPGVFCPKQEDIQNYVFNL